MRAVVAQALGCGLRHIELGAGTPREVGLVVPRLSAGQLCMATTEAKLQDGTAEQNLRRTEAPTVTRSPPRPYRSLVQRSNESAC
jgi:hypothetical protein